MYYILNLRKKWEATEIDAFRRSARKSRLDRVRNVVIKERMGVNG